MWAEHLDIARALTLIAEQNLPEGVARMGAALHLLQRDLVVLSLLAEQASTVPNGATTGVSESGHACPLLAKTVPAGAGSVDQD
ncbi:hypothetical protein KR52_05685 [Synechococcus sp. KORDI-52]|uniref:hypothetical protein n=1 Tax=Synechococcus sp. KORDI-52 TaxID=585425 RepID=UPI0004E0A680|nr:hypothetical protein [Synechococcus sp. KORDI-52]AII48632.1 hypothetical protein KR52_05685 [Synechococcus sp. KORDI-52]